MATSSEARLKRIERAGRKPKTFAVLENEGGGDDGLIWGLGIPLAAVITFIYVAAMSLASIFFNPGLETSHGDPADWYWKSWIAVALSSYTLIVFTFSILPAITRRYYSLPRYATEDQVSAVRTFSTFTGEEQSLARPVYIEFLSRDMNYASKPYEDAAIMWRRMNVAITKRRELYAEQEALDSYEAQHALAALESHNNDMRKELQERQS